MKTRSSSRQKSLSSQKSDIPQKPKLRKEILRKRGYSRSKSRSQSQGKGKREKNEIKCGICGKSTKLMKLECCNNWICDDYDKYVIFNTSSVSCHRNHDRYTLCSIHFHQGHGGTWQDCEECKKSMKPEIYIWHGTNEFNFEKLKEIPKFEPTKCLKCQRVINLGREPYAVIGDQYECFHCLVLEEKVLYNELPKDHQTNYSNEYPSNFIRTTKYSLLNCLPKSLLLQFKRYANIYFLIVAILQTFPTISPLQPFSAIAPLCFVLSLSLLREWMEDYERYKSDLEINKCTCVVLANGVHNKTQWRHVKVGHLILVKNNEIIPADMIMLSSNYENGVAYIETSSLDGEKNLKLKLGLPETLAYGKAEKRKELENWQVYAEVSNANLNSFDGVLIESELRKHSCNIKQLLLRGSKLKNTQWVIGIVVYTGFDTKVMRNSEKSRLKQSNIEQKTNRYIIWILLFELAICLVSTIAGLIWNGNNLANHSYITNGETFDNILTSFYNFLTYFLLNNSMIPISLIVSLEFVKVSQAYFMNKDEDMYSKETKRFIKVMSSSINEELGQVEYVFSDKTGTLTCNKMKFQGCIIGDRQYGHIPGGEPKKTSRIGQDKPEAKLVVKEERRKTIVDERSNLIFEFNDIKLKHLLKGRCEFEESENPKINLKFPLVNSPGIGSDVSPSAIYSIKSLEELAQQFFVILASCHECLIEQDDKTSYLHYQSQSPDEISLVDAARHLGFKFLGASSNQINIDILGEIHTLELLHCFEFNSDRKRMSVLVREKGIVKLFIKGADSTIKMLLDNKIDQPYKKFCERKIDEYSKVGFRCLCIAMRVISDQELQNFMALTQNKTSEQLLELANVLEKDLILLGVTVVEDKLQDDVPETIHDLLMADIKFWMLTGDKLETAENIGKSCKLLTPDMSLMRMCQGSLEAVSKYMDECLDIFKLAYANDKKLGCLVEGETLNFLLSKEELRKKFIFISSSCNAVICCRVTPKQKADVVRLIKTNLNKITVAIGDGANDVNMIQEAHIGIGIYGKEGMRAVQASDYAIGEFRCIWKLLLVHGRWSYIRISQMILYFFYKNMIVTIPQFFYGFLCAYSGQTIFDDWYITFYNMLFTALPLIIRAIFDQDLYYKTYKKDKSVSEYKIPQISVKSTERSTRFKENRYLKKYYPRIYYIGQNNTIFTWKNFVYWVIQGWFHGILVFIVTLYTLNNGIILSNGITADLWVFSIHMFSIIILMVDLKLALYTHSWTYLMGVSIMVGSLVIYFVYVWIADQIIQFNIFKTASLVFSTPLTYLSSFVTLMILLIFDISSIIISQELTDNLVYYFKYLVNNEQEDNKEYFENAIKKSLSKRKPSKREELLKPSFFFKGNHKDSSPSNASSRKKKFRDEIGEPNNHNSSLVIPLKEQSDGAVSSPGNHSDHHSKSEKIQFSKRKSQFSQPLGQLAAESEGITEDVCLKKAANKMTDVIILT